MKPVTREWSTSELRAVDDAGSFWAVRGPAPVLAWTALAPLGAYVLNAFAPRGFVFWSASVFRALGRSESAFVDEMRRHRGLDGLLASIFRSLAIPTKSLVAYERFGLLTAGAGDRYYPDRMVPDFFLHARRHFSLAVPEHGRVAVTEHFERQFEELHDEALKACDETVELVAHGAIDDDSKYALLGAHPLVMNPAQRANVLATIDAVGVDADEWIPGRDLNILYAYPGAISLGLPDVIANPAIRSDIVRVARFRATLAARICPLPVLERLRADLDTVGWRAMPDVRDELCSLFDRRLDAFAFVRDSVYRVDLPG